MRMDARLLFGEAAEALEDGLGFLFEAGEFVALAFEAAAILFE